MGFCMRIGVISDTHGSATAWKTAYEQLLRSADLIVHAGDVLYHGPRNPLPEGYDPASLARELNASAVPLLIAKGNCDSEVDQLVVDRPLQAPYAYCWIEGLRILVHHGHIIPPDEPQPYINKDTCDVFISGHTHVAGISSNSGVLCLNPGSPSLSKTGGGIPTIGWIEGGSVRIIRLDTGATIDQQHIHE